ncbi:MAG: hypothetical protein HYY45_14960 [Deltaproteobacteria bacterium]|nr:hypothetical protein [Deltaproteobacteria bacterium]
MEPNLIGGLIGGGLIGLASLLLLAVNGRLAGMSGIMGGLVTSGAPGDHLWRIALVAGLIAGAGGYGLVRLTGGYFLFPSPGA